MESSVAFCKKKKMCSEFLSNRKCYGNTSQQMRVSTGVFKLHVSQTSRSVSIKHLEFELKISFA